MKVIVDSVPQWVERITRWLANAQPEQLFFLSSCAQPSAYNLGDYELVVGIGSQQVYAPSLADFSWPEFKALTNQPLWKFFTLAYDFNQLVMPGACELRPDALAWPVCAVVVPEQVVTLSKHGELCIFGERSEGLYNELLAMDLSVQGQQECSSEVSYSAVEQSISQVDYINCVNQIKDDITRGDYYEINLCIELLLNQLQIDQPFALHRRLLQESPTPFASFVKLHHQHLLSASPERFLLGQGGSLVSQPIKGTSPRFSDAALDEASKAALLASEKERAEHIMIVDLMRNDLSRSAAVGSVRVPELCEIYSYRQVHQMVSTITSQPKAGVDWLTAMEHCFPMGSMTGAPKRRVLQAIAQYEPCARGWFSGSVGYIKPSGEFDSNVVIRSLMYDSQKQLGKYSVGSAITIDSDPAAEYEECLLKASAIRKVLN